MLFATGTRVGEPVDAFLLDREVLSLSGSLTLSVSFDLDWLGLEVGDILGSCLTLLRSLNVASVEVEVYRVLGVRLGIPHLVVIREIGLAVFIKSDPCVIRTGLDLRYVLRHGGLFRDTVLALPLGEPLIPISREGLSPVEVASLGVFDLQLSSGMITITNVGALDCSDLLCTLRGSGGLLGLGGRPVVVVSDFLDLLAILQTSHSEIIRNLERIPSLDFLDGSLGGDTRCTLAYNVNSGICLR